VPVYSTAFAGTHCAYPRRDGQAELTWVAGYVRRWFIRPQTVTHPSTNRARRRVTSLITTNALTTTTHHHLKILNPGWHNTISPGLLLTSPLTSSLSLHQHTLISVFFSEIKLIYIDETDFERKPTCTGGIWYDSHKLPARHELISLTNTMQHHQHNTTSSLPVIDSYITATSGTDDRWV